ncbi:hypothetical protein [Mycobacterium sp. 1164966.3]|uniref:hypothetical protein n=1 Tax=Mycobacterium sp. 1164966.3 TaxID=1856861 RepID=UPI0009EE3FAE|nr:hypothetical protein [Mycobacterium sp. 1164966.3]
MVNRAGSRPTGPALVVLSGSCVGLLFGGIGVGVALGGVMPLPYGPLPPIQEYVRDHPVAVQTIAVAMFASSVPLAGYAAAASARLRQLGVTGLRPTIALTGGILAAGSLALAGLVGWTLTRPEVSGDTALVRALYILVFLIGGPGHVVALGVLVAAMAAAGLTPKPVARIGLAIAALAESATAVLMWTRLGVILPVARVLALGWLVVAGASLARDDLDAM